MATPEEAPIQRALKQSEIVFAYQPVVDLRTGTVLYVEALVRWRHASGVVRMPGDFMHLIDTPRLADLFTETTLSSAADALPTLRRRFGDDIRVGVNLSNLQLRAAATELAVDASQTHGSDWLTIEIVEDLVVDDLTRVKVSLSKMRDAGIKVLLDDFGTGNTTLSLLAELAYDGLKLDRRYVSAITQSVPARVLVEALIRYGHEAEVDVIAEGVETAATSNALEDLQCRYAQGYFCGRPLFLEEMHLGSNSSSATSDTASIEPESIQLEPSTPRTIETAKTIREAIVAELRQLEPMTTTLDFEQFVDALSDLEGRTLCIQPEEHRIDLLIDVRMRQVLAASYFSRLDLLFAWAVDLAQFCEEHGRSARQAQALALVVGGESEDPDQRSIAAHALVRVLQIRDRGRMTLDQMTRLDNSIGVIFSNLGMFDQGRRWWLNSYRRGRGLELRERFITCLNLLEHTLTLYEIPVASDAAGVSSEDLDLLDELLVAVREVPALSPIVHASFSSRRHVLVGDLECARQVLAKRDATEATGILETCQGLRAEAMLARASGDAEGFLRATQALVEARPERGLLLLQLRSIDRLRAEALALSGQYEEAYAFLHDVLESETAESVRSKQRVYAWLQNQAGLDRPFVANAAHL